MHPPRHPGAVHPQANQTYEESSYTRLLPLLCLGYNLVYEWHKNGATKCV